jgi:ribosomal protein S18 acetylase RimI-like enzyme
VPGFFRVWEQAGALAVLATDPALGFLSTVSGVARETIPAAIDLINAPGWSDVKPAMLVPAELDEAAERLLLTAGLVRTADRLLAINRLTARSGPVAGSGLEVIAAGADDAFVDVLLAGYEVDGPVAAFIRAEHRLPMMQRFLVVARGTPIAAAAMTIDDDVAVLGGASTLRACRGQGAQSLLLRHCLRVAADADCVLAVATARPESVSAANLRRVGFGLQRRATWMKT